MTKLPNACLRWLAAETPNLDEVRATARRADCPRWKTRIEAVARIRALLGQRSGPGARYQ